MIAALLIRLASLSLPKKIRQKYLRAWLAELQDAKADGEGWAFAYDLLVNMGSLKKAAQGEDILYRNQSKTPLWLSMGSLGTAVLATVVAVSFWNGLKTPPSYVNAPVPSGASGSVIAEASKAVSSDQLDSDQLDSDQLDSLAFSDALNVESEAMVEIDTGARALNSFDSDLNRDLNRAKTSENLVEVQESAEDQNEEISSETIEVTSQLIENVSTGAEAEADTLELADSTEEISVEIIEKIAEGETQSIVESSPPVEAAPTPATARLITPNPAPTQAGHSNDDSVVSITAEVIVEAPLPTEGVSDERSFAGETAPEVEQNLEASNNADTEVTSEVMAINPAPVQPVGRPGEAGIPNIPGVDVTANNTSAQSAGQSIAQNSVENVENLVGSNSSNPPVLPPPSASALAPMAAAPVQTQPVQALSASEPVIVTPVPTVPVVVEVQPLTANVTSSSETSGGSLSMNQVESTVPAITPETRDTSGGLGAAREFQEPSDVDTTIVITETEIERPNIAEDLSSFRQQLLTGAQSGAALNQESIDGIDNVQLENSQLDNVQGQLEDAQKAVESLTQNPNLNTGLGLNSPNTENQLGLPGRSGDSNESISNPIADIADEEIQDLIDDFLETGDLSFENSAELISKLAERLGLGEEQIRELLRALVGRLEP